MRRVLALSLAFVLGEAALGADPARLEEILSRHEGQRGALARESARVREPGERERRLAALLEKQADELSSYATTAPLASGTIARARATDSLLEALRLLLSKGAAAAPKAGSEDVARVTSLRSTLERCGADTEARAFALVYERARRDGQAAATAALDERVRTRAPEIAAVLKDHAGRVLVALVTDAREPAARTPEEKDDERERRALKDELGQRGLELLEISGEGARGLGVLTGKVELVLDRKGRVRGVDLVGQERRSLVRALVEEAP